MTDQEQSHVILDGDWLNVKSGMMSRWNIPLWFVQHLDEFSSFLESTPETTAWKMIYKVSTRLVYKTMLSIQSWKGTSFTNQPDAVDPGQTSYDRSPGEH